MRSPWQLSFGRPTTGSIGFRWWSHEISNEWQLDWRTRNHFIHSFIHSFLVSVELEATVLLPLLRSTKLDCNCFSQVSFTSNHHHQQHYHHRQSVAIMVIKSMFNFKFSILSLFIGSILSIFYEPNFQLIIVCLSFPFRFLFLIRLSVFFLFEWRFLIVCVRIS